LLLALLLLVLAATLFIGLVLAEDLMADLLADDLGFGLRRADVEREVIVSGTCVQPERTAKFKRALIGIGESAPIRDK
jgi:hypothetical protein